jgi:hypothetical protein
MHVLFGGLVAMALAAPSGDPRTIDPAANRPEIVAPGGAPAKARPVKTRPPKVEPKVKPPKVKPPKVEPKVKPPKVEPKTEPKVEPKTEPKTEPKVEPKVEPEPDAEPKVVPKTAPKPDPAVADAPLQRCFPERGRCWRLNVAGIVAASVGVGMLGTGIGFMQAPQFPVPDEPIFNRSLRPPGVVLVALGAVTTVTGVLMIVAGHAAHGKAKREGLGRRRRPAGPAARESRTARVQLVPGGLRW